MNSIKNLAHIRRLFAFFILLLPLCAQAQQHTHFSAILVDSLSRVPISFAHIFFDKYSGNGTTSNASGYFEISSPEGQRSLTITSVGYDTLRVVLPEGVHSLRLERLLMSPSDVELSSVVVTAKRKRYSRRNNPAVDLIRRVIAAKDSNRIESLNSYSYDSYERLLISDDAVRPDKGYLHLSDKELRPWIDISALTGKFILPLSLRETAGTVVKRPGSSELVVTNAKRLDGVEERLDEGLITANIEELFRPIDIYDNDIPLLHNRFPSPLSSVFAVSFYKYFIRDTVMIEGRSCIELDFTPFNKQSIALEGRIFIDSETFALRRIAMNLPQQINLNWIDRMRIVQDFQSVPVYNEVGTALRQLNVLKRQDFNARISIASFLPQGMEVEQSRVFTKHQLAQLARVSDSLSSVYAQELKDIAPLLMTKPARGSRGYWDRIRPEVLPTRAYRLLDMMDYLRRDNTYNAANVFAKVLSTGYLSLPIQVGRDAKPYFDLGPVYSLLSANGVEGMRFRIGGMTLAKLHPQLFAQGYLAYGSKDKRWKWMGRLVYSFRPKLKYAEEFPRNAISLETYRDLFVPGQLVNPLYKDHLFSLLGNSSSDKRSLIQEYKLSYERDWNRSLTSRVWISRKKDSPMGSLQYIQYAADGTEHPLNAYRLSEFGIHLRFEANRTPVYERSSGGATSRLLNRAPVIELEHRMAFDGVLGSDYSYQRSSFGIRHRLWLSAMGMLSLSAEAGAVWTRAPYPLLEIPRAVDGFIIKSNAFHLMKPLEFIADRYLSWHASYHMGGLVLNRVPLIKHLGLREIVSIHGFWGALSGRNALGQSGTFVLDEGINPAVNTLYLEGSVGLENILRLFRVELFHRIRPKLEDAKNWGLRVRFQVHF